MKRAVTLLKCFTCTLGYSSIGPLFAQSETKNEIIQRYH